MYLKKRTQNLQNQKGIFFAVNVEVYLPGAAGLSPKRVSTVNILEKHNIYLSHKDVLA